MAPARNAVVAIPVGAGCQQLLLVVVGLLHLGGQFLDTIRRGGHLVELWRMAVIMVAAKVDSVIAMGAED